MDFEALLNSIDICDGGKAVFARLNAKADPVTIASAYAAYDAGDEAFAEFLELFAKAQNVTTEEANLFWYLHLSSRTYRFYQEKKIDDSVFYATMKAFAVTCAQCYDKFRVYGIQQRVYRAWYRRQLNGTLFRLGRLEFEIVSSNYDVTLEGCSLAKGDTCISVHIPRGEALDPWESEEAYVLARAFFKEKFQIAPCVFYCGSWLLHPWISEDFSESSLLWM